MEPTGWTGFRLRQANVPPLLPMIQTLVPVDLQSLPIPPLLHSWLGRTLWLGSGNLGLDGVYGRCETGSRRPGSILVSLVVA